MIIKKIEPYLKDNELNISLLLGSTKTDLRRDIDYKELSKINIGDDIQVQNGKIKILKKNNRNKFLLQRICPVCGGPLTSIKENDEEKKLVCNNIYGCQKQREDLLTKWCVWYKIKLLVPIINPMLKYFSLDNFILDRTIKKSIEKAIPMLYFMNVNMVDEWLKNTSKANKIIEEINESKNKIVLADIFFIFPNKFTVKQIEYLIKQYKTIKGLFNIQEREMPILEKVFSKKSIVELFDFLSTHKETFDLLEKSGINLDNKKK